MKMNRRQLVAGAAALPLFSIGRAWSEPLDVLDDKGADLLPDGAALETLGEGYGWSEGPTWDRARDCLYYTDVPGNRAYRWSREAGVNVFLEPSGTDRAEGFREPGANGLWYADDGRLLLCNHGLRRVEALDLETKERTTLADSFEGLPFNSPNDLIKADGGDIYFTDPPYGLAGGDDSPLKKQAANGVYHLSKDGQVTRMLDDMTRPNGVALSPNGRRLYITQSDPERPILRELKLGRKGRMRGDRIITDFSPLMGPDNPGLPDGMAVATNGDIFVGGPGGVVVLNKAGKPIARIKTDSAAANCCFGEDGRTLFITAHQRLVRVRTNRLGVQWS